MSSYELLTNANFKIDKTVWTMFKSIAKQNNTDASKVLRDCVLKYLKNNEEIMKK